MLNMNDVCSFLEEHGIEYTKYENVNGSGVDFVYLHHGCYGHPTGVEIERNEFRPDFRISIHGDEPEGRVYTRVCGYISYMTLDEVLKEVGA